MARYKNIRIGNISFKVMQDSHYDGEFLCHYPNVYYKKEADYIQDQNDPDYYLYPDNPHCRIHKGCFVHPESCYVVAWLGKGEEPDITTVGDRPWQLSKTDRGDFDTIVKMVFERAYNIRPDEDGYDDE